MSNASTQEQWRVLTLGPGMLPQQQSYIHSFVVCLVLPDCYLSVVAAGRQHARLLGVPGHAVHVLAVGFADVGGQGEDGLVGVRGRVLFEHAHAVIATGGHQGTGQTTPKHK